MIDLEDYTNSISKHVHLSTDQWILALFRKDECSFRPKHIIDDFESWQEEFKRNPKTTFAPKKIEVTHNVLALTGLTESAKRDTGETSTTARYVGIGTGTTAESESQTALVTEDSGAPYARKDLTLEGQRKVLNQTAKYGVTFDDGDISSVPKTLREGGLFSASTGGVMHARVLFSAFTLSSGDLFVIQINELHANGTL